MSSLSLLAAFALNLIVAIIIVRFIYYPAKPNKNYVFTFLAFNSSIFFVMTLLSSIEMSVGMGFGLFAIFSVLQYRTNTMPTREMSYLFILIILGIINSTLLGTLDLVLIILANLMIPLLLFWLEKGWGFHYEASKRISYDRIELILPQHRSQLLSDLESRTGLKIKRIEIGSLDFLKDSANIKIYYDEGDSSAWHEEGVVSGGEW
ncbi:MAG: DUF4956 domain-containing protein [Deinococcales bacterium]